MGRTQEYEVLPLAPYCGCDDFYFNVVQGSAFLCYHLIAQKLATALNRFELLEKPDELHELLMRQWRTPQPEGMRPAYLDQVEDLKEASLRVLGESGNLSSRDLYLRLVALGFEIPSPRNLAMALWADQRKRFRRAGKVWTAAGSR